MIEQRILDLPTPRLFKYFKKNYRNRRGRMDNLFYSWSEITEEEYNEFMDEYNALKTELATREHIE